MARLTPYDEPRASDANRLPPSLMTWLPGSPHEAPVGPEEPGQILHQDGAFANPSLTEGGAHASQGQAGADNAISISISTGELRGSSVTPITDRGCFPFSPKTWVRSLEPESASWEMFEPEVAAT